MRPTVRPSTAEDCRHLATRLRAADLWEIELMSGNDPLTSLLNGLNSSDDPRTILASDGEPVGMFGAAPFSPGVATVWMLASDRIEEPAVARAFLRWSRPWVADMQSRWPVLFNYIWSENHVLLRWLEWCGFEIASTPLGELKRFERHLNV